VCRPYQGNNRELSLLQDARDIVGHESVSEQLRGFGEAVEQAVPAA